MIWVGLGVLVLWNVLCLVFLQLLYGERDE